MLWSDRVNGNGKPFRQWHATREFETPPAWGPGEAQLGCPVCGETYERRYLDIAGNWHESKRDYIYHDPVMHRSYKRDGLDASMDLHPPRDAA